MDRYESRHGTWRWRVLPVCAAVLMLGAVFSTAIDVLGRHGYFLQSDCIPSASWTTLGVRLSLLHESGACPGNAVALGGSTQSTITVLGVLVVPLVLAHLLALVAAGGIGLWTHAVVVAVARGAERAADAVGIRTRDTLGIRLPIVPATGLRRPDHPHQHVALSMTERHAKVRTRRGPPVGFPVPA